MGPTDNLPYPRHTARGIVLRGDQILLMERWRPGLHYFSIPGGGIEADETPEQCAGREILEETSIVVHVGREVFQMRDGDIIHHIFLCEYVSGEPVLPADAPEALLDATENRFKPGWVTVMDLRKLNLGYWQPLHQNLLHAVRNDFSGPLTIVTAAETA